MADASKRDRHKRAILLSVPSKDWEEVAMALTHEAKNLYNTITFLIRQVVSAYDYVSETKTSVLKDDLHQNQRDVIAAFNAMVGQINAKRIAKAKSENQDKVRLLTELTPTMSVSPLNVVLNVTLLDNVVRGWTDGDGHRVYRRLPAASAQQVVRSVIDAWKATLSAISDWAKHPEKYTGRPGFPRFLHKNGHFPLEIPFAMMTKGFPKPRTFLRLDRLGDRSEALQEAFYAHDLRTAVTHACRKRGWDVFHPQHLLLDEFQDTNREQWEALRSLLPSDTHPESQRSSAFFVGDTKQAIYGWRGGCAAIFDSLNEDVANIHWEQLDQSYRSSQTILEFVDRVFRGLSRSDTLAAYPELLERWKKAYTRSVAAIPRRGLAELIIAPRSVLLSSTADAEPGEDDDSAFTPYESWGVTKILEIIRDHPRSSVGILTRTNKYARRLAIRLMVEGIDASLEGPGTLVDDSAVELVLSAITFADHPGSDAAAFHVFHSPLSAQLGFTEFTDDQRNRTALALRESVIARGWGHTISWLCRLLAPWSDARSARRLSSLVEAADEYDRSPGRRPVEFVDMIRTRTLRDSVPSPVRVMSIHQAKGLEFDVVILPELQRTIPAKTPPVMIVRQTETGPITAIYPYAAESIRACSPELVSAHQRYHQRILGDELNLLYVAMTRPRNALYMLIPPKKLKPDGTASATGKPTLGDIVRGALDIPNEAEDYDHRVGDLDLGGAGDSASDSGPMIEQVAPERVVFACRSPRRRWPDLSPSSAAREHTDAIRSLFGMNRDARDRGTLLHGWLQQIEWIEDGVPGTDQLLDIARITLPHRKPEWAEGFLEDYHRMLRSPAVTATLSRPGIEAVLFREHAITARIRGSLVRGRVDRMVVTSEPTGSVATITDFKTDMIGADAVATRAELLAPQIRSYAECVSEVFRIPMERIRSQLLFVQPEIAVTIEVRPSPARPTP